MRTTPPLVAGWKKSEMKDEYIAMPSWTTAVTTIPRAVRIYQQRANTRKMPMKVDEITDLFFSAANKGKETSTIPR
jgi:hypothetical protein